MAIFKRNRKYYSLLREEKEGYWVDENPLFVSENQGLYPVFKTGGPQGRFPKNHQELILKSIGGQNVKFRQTFSKGKNKSIQDRI